MAVRLAGFHVAWSAYGVLRMLSAYLIASVFSWLWFDAWFFGTTWARKMHPAYGKRGRDRFHSLTPFIIQAVCQLLLVRVLQGMMDIVNIASPTEAVVFGLAVGTVAVALDAAHYAFGPKPALGMTVFLIEALHNICIVTVITYVLYISKPWKFEDYLGDPLAYVPDAWRNKLQRWSVEYDPEDMYEAWKAKISSWFAGAAGRDEL